MLAVPGLAQQVIQPPPGSALRAHLLDVARPTFQGETGGPIEFVVRQLNVMNDWAFGDVVLQRPGGGRIDWRSTKFAETYKAGSFDPGSSYFLLHNVDGTWALVEYAVGPTDVAWDWWRKHHKLPEALFRH
jgi:hypothetical protein